MGKFKSRGESLSELALCLAVITAAVMGMHIYIQRSLMARYKDGAGYLFSKIEEEAVARSIVNLTNLKPQHDPYYQESNMTETKNSEITTGFPNTVVNETLSQSGWQKVRSAVDAD